MALRFQLIHDSLGPLIVDIADPIGINEITKTIKRSSDNEGVIFEIVFDVDFIKKSRLYIKQAFEEYGGIDAVVLVNLYYRDANARRWRLYGNGKINFNKYDVYEDKVTVNIEQSGFQRRVLNLLERDVDLETTVSENGSALPVNLVIDMPYHSKTLLKETGAKPSGTEEYQQLSVFVFHINEDPFGGNVTRDQYLIGNIDTSGGDFAEIEEKFSLPFGWVPIPQLAPGSSGTRTTAEYITGLNAVKDGRFEIIRFKEAGQVSGTVVIDLRHNITADNAGGDTDVCGEGALGNVEILYWYELRDDLDNIIDLQNIGKVTAQPCGTSEFPYQQFNFTLTNVPVQVGYKLYIYETFRVFGSYNPPNVSDADVFHNLIVQSSVNTNMDFTSRTTAPESNAKTVLIYEAFQRCCQYYTNQIDCFRSELLGRTEHGYEQDGEYSMIGFTNGKNLRNIDGQLFFNLQELIDFINSVACVGFGFETVDGREVLRLEKREYFYNKGNKVASLGKVFNVKARLDSKRFYNQIEYGYAGKLDIGQINAIDEFNTVRKSAIPITNTKNSLKISTKMYAGGYQIEAQRRLQFSTADGKLDDENFAVVVIRDGGSFRTKKDEGYTSITGVIDPPSGYNYDISPRRNLENWKKFLAAVLIRSADKVVKFSSGEVNYTMTTQKAGEAQPLAENGDLDVSSIEPDYEGIIYEVNDVPLSSELFIHLCSGNNPYGVLEFQDQFGNTLEGFVSDDGVEHDSTKKTADIKLLKVWRG